MRIAPPKRWELMAGGGVCLLGGIATLFSTGASSDIRFRDVLGFCLFASLGALMFYAELLRRSRVVEVDVAAGLVRVNRRNWLFRWVCESYSLGRFGRVRSIVTNIGQHNSVHVDLIERDVGHALTLALFSPSSKAKSFNDRPKDDEPPLAAELRHSVASLTGLVDSGFEGSQFPPPNSNPDLLA